MKQLQTFNSNNQAVAFGQRKQHKVTLEDVIARLDNVVLEMKKGFEQVNTRLDNIVKLNNLKE